jgi:hypothetical protein
MYTSRFVCVLLVSTLLFCGLTEARKPSPQCMLACSLSRHAKSICTKACLQYEKAQQLNTNAIVLSDTGSANTPITSELLWAMYRSELIKALTYNKNDRPMLQILQIAEDAVWDQDKSALDRFCDYVPYWGQYYTRTPYQISSQYSDWLNEISMGQDIVNHDAYNKLEAERQRWKQLSAQLGTKRQQCTASVSAQRPANKAQFDQLMNDCVADAKTKLEDSNYMIEFYSLQAYSTVSNDLITARQQVADGMSYKESGNTLARFRAGQGGQSINFSVSRSNYNQQSSTWEAIASKGVVLPGNLQSPFITNPESKMPQLISTLETFSLELSIPAFTIIQVSPGDWFRRSLVQSYASRQYINDQQIGNRLFGNGGTMKLMPKALFVVKNPSMTLTLDRRDEAHFDENKIKSSGGFFSSRKETFKVTKTYTADNRLRVTLSANTDVPQVIAVDHEALP